MRAGLLHALDSVKFTMIKKHTYTHEANLNIFLINQVIFTICKSYTEFMTKESFLLNVLVMQGVDAFFFVYIFKDYVWFGSNTILKGH